MSSLTEEDFAQFESDMAASQFASEFLAESFVSMQAKFNGETYTMEYSEGRGTYGFEYREGDGRGSLMFYCSFGPNATYDDAGNLVYGWMFSLSIPGQASIGDFETFEIVGITTN